MSLEYNEALKQLESEYQQWSVTQNSINNYVPPETIEATIKKPSGYIREIIEPTALTGAKLPWVKTWNHIRLPGGELSLWAGTDGHRKSLVLGQVALDFCIQGYKCAIASFEMKPATTLRRIAGQAIGNTEFNNGLVHSKPAESAIKKFLDYIDDKLFIYDKIDTISPEEVYRMCEYCAGDLEVKHIFIDSLMMVDINMGSEGKALNEQKNFAKKLVAITKKYDCHIHLVTHFTKTDPLRFPTRQQIAGTKALSNIAFNVFIVYLNERRAEEGQKPEELRDPKIMEKSEMIIKPDKQRERTFRRKIHLDFDDHSLQVTEGHRIPYWEKFL